MKSVKIPSLTTAQAGPMPDWTGIDTVLLDMDGTLLDLYFDNVFWQEHLPLRYAEIHDLDPAEARARLYQRFDALRGTMNWYCVDYWSEALELDVTELKREVAHLIALRPDVPDFLGAVRASGRRAVLVTNAHHKSLAMKIERTGIDAQLDAVISAHSVGLPKEETSFWERLQALETYDPARTLLIDDNIAVLESARRGGIAYLLFVAAPDSRQAARACADFPALHAFRDILPPPPPAASQTP